MSDAGANGSQVDVLTIDHTGELFVVPAQQVLEISARQSFAEVRDREAAARSVDLDHLLLSAPAAEASSQGRAISVRFAGGIARLFTTAELHLRAAGRRTFYDLPRVLGAGACEGWVKGIVLWERPEEALRLAVWLDLVALADLSLDQNRKVDVVGTGVSC